MKPTIFSTQKSLTLLLASSLLLAGSPGSLRAATETTAGRNNQTEAAEALNANAVELQQLRQQLEILSKQIQRLEAQQQQQAEQVATAQATAQAAVSAQEQAQVQATAQAAANAQALAEATAKAAPESHFKLTAGPGGFGIASSDGDYAFRFRGLVQFDNRVFFDSSTSSDQNKFILRRLRPIFEGKLAKIYDFRFVPELGGGDASSSSVGLIDAWLGATPYKEFGIRFGKFTSPAVLESGSGVSFVEATLANNLLPNRDIGIETYGTTLDGLLTYRAGVFNGARNNSTAFNQDIKGGNKSFAGRLTVAPFIAQKDSDLAGLHLSLGTRIGFSSGGTNTGLSNYRTSGQQTFLNWGNLEARGGDFQLNPAIEWYPGKPYSAVAEFALEHQEIFNPANSAKFNITNTAWRLTGGYVLTGEARTKSGVKPARPFDWGGGNWGAFEVVARVGGLYVDNALFNPSEGNLSTATNASGAFAFGAGITWYLNENLRVLTNIEQTNFTDATARSNELYWFTRFQLSF